jgi:hypothetical protein
LLFERRLSHEFGSTYLCAHIAPAIPENKKGTHRRAIRAGTNPPFGIGYIFKATEEDETSIERRNTYARIIREKIALSH